MFYVEQCYVEQCLVFVIYAPMVFLTTYMWPETVLFCCHPFSFVTWWIAQPLLSRTTRRMLLLLVCSTATELKYRLIVGPSFECVHTVVCCACNSFLIYFTRLYSLCYSCNFVPIIRRGRPLTVIFNFTYLFKEKSGQSYYKNKKLKVVPLCCQSEIWCFLIILVLWSNQIPCC